MNKELKLYIVKWGDAWASLNHYREDGDHSPMVMEDVGWVLEETDETIVLCTSRCLDNDNKRNLSVIPWVNVISMEELV